MASSSRSVSARGWAWLSVGDADGRLRRRAAQRISAAWPASAPCSASPLPVTLALVGERAADHGVHRQLPRVERVAIVVGGFELVFLLVAWAAHPSPGEIACRRTVGPAPRPEISLSRLRQHRRRHHAVDGVLSAVADCGKEADEGRSRRCAARHRQRRGADPAHHGGGPRRRRGDPRQSGRRSRARHGSRNQPGDHTLLWARSAATFCSHWG